MKEYSLAEIFDKPISGEWGNEISDGQQGVKVIRTTNFTNKGIIDLKDVVNRDIDIDRYSSKVLQKGDIIIEKSGGSPNQPVGRTVLFEGIEEICFCNNFTAILRPLNRFNSKYILYMLMNLYNQRIVLKYQNKTTGIINLKLNDYLAGTKVSIPNKEIQNRIANVLDKAQELIDKRKEQIEACDELIKSLFYHMFGDPVKNDKYWTKSEFENGIFELKYGTSQPPEFSDVGIPFIRATNIKNARISEKSMLFISKHEAKKIEKCRLRKGDIIVVRSGANTGDSTFIPEKYENAYGGYDIIIRLNDRLNWYYVISLFNSSYREVIINPLTRRAGQPHLNSQQIKDLEICYPPIELQNEFAQKVEKIEQQKHLLEQSLTELENNFNSLMQRAFKGELF